MVISVMDLTVLIQLDLHCFAVYTQTKNFLAQTYVAFLLSILVCVHEP